MKLWTAVIAAALLLAGPARADEDCDTVVKALEDVQLVATKTLDRTMDDIKKATSEPADDKKKASVKNSFCSASGEYLGTTRAFRAVAAGGRQEEGLAFLARQVDQGDGDRDRQYLQVTAIRFSDFGLQPLLASSAAPLAISAPPTSRRKAISLSPV